ncbi:putative Sulfate transporter [Vibrio nigripulchritudo SFn27]|uniref:Putative Sulfate transporter n=1 Tax=Vibrio nigripulchritudo TaxID=28173 RepID=U4JZL7_9VIBR|nr:SulP family inorganic anion transporter [Vibrio nigripulchritudo]CCN84870.1 putative Sulfate transporter [Vibrio nigripulchritudo BLFn1]CCN90081.1 putative Sulfate transporter [Vibrio nigripulchritudo SFn27]CCN94306.1 putative Sulfate transporter [Vibrio nigripulchritudo ENn2]CCO42660.1 putative Sulfate transporter [Vibrio nigripulchritudo SFn135]CCO51236.1 putative Sulfate transporter [Vibrio nigripulchritudo Wn13]
MFEFPQFSKHSVKNDVLSGLTVALALVPEAVAFAFVAGVDPMVGLYAAFIVGLITSVFGGRPGMISGATGAMAVVMTSLVISHGIQYLFAAILLAGILQIAAGIFKLGKFIRMVPHPVMIGFVNGLAIVIFLAQLGQFKAPDIDGMLTWLPSDQMFLMLGLVALTMAIIHFLPKFTTAVPSSLVAIVTVTGLVVGLDLETRTVVDFLRTMSGDEAATLAGSLPTFSVPNVPLSLETLQVILPYAIILAAIGLIESLLTLTVLDEMTNTRGQSNRECVGQGMANVTCSMFGAMGGCAMIGQSMINVNSGGRGRLSGIVAALALLFFILFASDLIEMIPLAALVGVMFMVVIGTFEWATFKLARRVPKQDFFVIVLVTVVTVLTDLAVAVAVGVIASALMFAWEHAKHIYATSKINEEGSKEYHINGPIFFGSAANFLELFDAKNDPEDVIVDFADSRVADHSAIEAIETLAERYAAAGKTLHLRHLSQDCRALLDKAGSLVEINVKEDPSYKVATDVLAG